MNRKTQPRIVRGRDDYRPVEFRAVLPEQSVDLHIPQKGRLVSFMDKMEREVQEHIFRGEEPALPADHLSTGGQVSVAGQRAELTVVGCIPGPAAERKSVRTCSISIALWAQNVN